MLRLIAAAMFLAIVSPAVERFEPLPVEEIVERLVAADNSRFEKLEKYTAERRYVLVNKRFGKRAEMVARITYRKPGEKTFEILSESGPGLVRSRVLKRMMEAEADASRTSNRTAARFLPANYFFKLLGMETVEGRPCYVLRLDPRTDNKYLVRGKAWVDASEFAVVRVEGTPATNPSFWIKNTRVVQQNGKVDSFWLPLANRSTTDARIFGKTDVSIDYYEYRVNTP
jgi:hypothetical protein